MRWYITNQNWESAVNENGIIQSLWSWSDKLSEFRNQIIKMVLVH